MKKLLSFITVLLLLFSLAAITGGCSGKQTAATESTKKITETKKVNPQKEVHDFVIKNTKMIKVFSINQRVNPKTPDLGPLYLVRGIDGKGQKSEVWVKDNKIYEMSNAN